ncbi:MAG: hypothetical protein KC560_20300 [Myxococcales bacterium]|nr:hypothetical protein [Myxococcales bacterium]
MNERLDTRAIREEQARKTWSPLREAAMRVELAPFRDRAVFYTGAGAARARALVEADPTFMRLDDALAQTGLGRLLLDELLRVPAFLWPHTEQVWWELSYRFALSASGDVHCFGDERDLVAGELADPFRSRFATAPGRYVDEVFWKVELPALDGSDRVEIIHFNGRPLDLD